MTPREFLELRGLAEYGVFPKPKTYEGFPHQAIEVATEPCLLPFPHYSDDRFRHEQLLYLSPDTELSAISWDYGDRFRSWDSEKTKEAEESANVHRYRTVQWFEAFIESFYDSTRSLKAVAGCVNHSSGYEIFILGSVPNGK